MAENAVGDGTGRGLIAFLNYVASAGLMNANTAGGLRAASKEVLSSVEASGWEELDLRTVDTTDFADRFERLRPGKYKPDSLVVYKSRFRNAVQMYLAYLENPGRWRYMAVRPASTRKKRPPRTGGVTIQGPQPSGTSLVGASTPRATTIDYPFPLRPGLVVSIRLPADLTKLEADRLSVFIKSVAVDLPNVAERQGAG